ncbi:MAG: class I SAM-dependent RNA methyltransferase [Clostridiales bacterium]|nr:class I SAM-dependent RNA methyltransferase [Clostridiales bacterium]
MEFFATAAFGLEGMVKKELFRLGLEGRCETGGVRFSATPAQAFSANLWLRTADRVLLIVGEEKVQSFEELFQLVLSLPWEKYLPRDARFPVSGKCARSQLMSVRDCQAITKKAIVERMKRHYKIQWFEETGAEYQIDVSLHGDMARLTLDTSGAALNKRGYRTWNGEAPIRETLAAALVMLSPFRNDIPLWDPCCGTGTLLIEAAYLRANRAPGLTRNFACERWPLFPKKEMDVIREEANDRFDPSRIGAIGGSDLSPDALALCKKHLKQAGIGGKVTVMQKDLRDLQLEMASPLFLLNPPYGERLSDRKECESLYRHIRKLYDRHPGCQMGVITAHTGFERCFGKRADQKRRLYNGRLECEFIQYQK